MVLLFTGFFVQAEEELNQFKLGGFFALNVGMAIDTKLTKFDCPTSISYGGNILKDRYVGVFEVGLGSYRTEYYVPVPLLFKYAYDFIRFRSHGWSLGIDTALHLGGFTRDGYSVAENGTTHQEKGIELYIGHDLGLFVKKRITARSLVVLLRTGINNAWIIQSSFIPVKSGKDEKSSKEEEEIKVTGELLNPHFYLGTGIQWYF